MSDKPELFYSGKHNWMGPVKCSWLPEPIIPVKIPEEELAIEDMPIIRADLGDLDE